MNSRTLTACLRRNLWQDRSLKMGIANKRLAEAWNKDYLCQLIGLKPNLV